MASDTGLRANTSPLKRSFDCTFFAAEPQSFDECNRAYWHHAERRSLSVSSTTINHQTHRYRKRRTLSTPSVNIMHVQDTAIMSTSFPSFMSVYGSEDTSIYSHAISENDAKREQLGLSQLNITTNHNGTESQPSSGDRRGSLNSIISYSTESSPTTTSSTFDSPLMADQSPGSSPESASSAMPPKSFQQPRMRSTGTQTLDLTDNNQGVLPTRPLPTQVLEDPKKNLKNLTLDMKLPSLIRPGTAPTLDSLQPFSAPTSPLRDQTRPGRKKPTNLTIRTPGFNQLTFGNSPAIPPTPGQKPMLHQAQSSPMLPTLASPTTGPVGGMRLTLPNIAQHLGFDSSFGGSTPASAMNLPSLREEGSYEPPKSQEAPERGYTSGPCLIYDSGVFLYLEPTAEEASKFDTVINVAKEIKNPFESSSNENGTVMSVWRTAGNRQSVAEPQTAMSEFSFKSALEWPTSSDPATPTTPRPSSSSQLRKPEYLHVKWDHNSEILDDLLPLCRLIDERVQEGKKVLIHCQLGVSRSASLIIAYGLYKGYESDFHSMYTTVKKRSQWVGPNMSLIYQLTDFKSKCDKGEYLNVIRYPKPEWFAYTMDNAFTPTNPPQSTLDTKQASQMGRLGETQPPLLLNKELPPVPLFDQGTKSSNASNRPNFAENAPTIKPVLSRLGSHEKPAKRAAPRPLPFREREREREQQRERMQKLMIIPPHRPRIIPGLTFVQPSMDLAMQDVPAVPSLFSPRASEFMATPFGITTAGDLVTSTPKTVKPPPGAFPGGREWRNSLLLGPEITVAQAATTTSEPLSFDPRSPHQTGEVKEIFRSIDDML